MSHLERVRTTLIVGVLAVALVAVVVACGSEGTSAGIAAITTPEGAWAAVLASEPRFAGIPPNDPEVIGRSSWYQIHPGSEVGTFVVTIVVGWGDCQAGCIERHTWTIEVSSDATITILAEDGPTIPPGRLTEVRDALTGIRIVATAGPVCPVEQNPPDPACAPRAVSGAPITVRADDGSVAAEAVTGLDGTVVIALHAGSYTVESGAVEGLIGTPAPTTVSVDEGAVETVDIAFDTGIR